MRISDWSSDVCSSDLGMFFFGQAHDALTWGLLAIIGLAGGMGQLCLTGALRWAPVSVVLPMDYSSLIWATLFGWLIWDHWPGESTLAGAALIVASRAEARVVGQGGVRTL